GHGAFSKSRTVCNVTGWVLHSALLVPYYSFKYSHSQHHKGTNSMTRDKVFIPLTKSQHGLQNKLSTPAWITETIFEESPVYHLFMVVLQSLFGWPMYLIYNSSGPKYAEGASHFNPNSVLFKPENFWQIVISDVGLLLTASAIVYYSFVYSAATVMYYYGVPYLTANFLIVSITFLQHTDAAVPHYNDDAWNF
ncbi:hypothetical protein LPJ75_006477, partial [Coemansia sp. RSA 2598]